MRGPTNDRFKHTFSGSRIQYLKTSFRSFWGGLAWATVNIARSSIGQSTLPNRSTSITGTVGSADYNFWRSRFGAISGAGSGDGSTIAAAVPEPATLVMLMLAATGFCFRRRPLGNTIRPTIRGTRQQTTSLDIPFLVHEISTGKRGRGAFEANLARRCP